MGLNLQSLLDLASKFGITRNDENNHIFTNVFLKNEVYVDDAYNLSEWYLPFDNVSLITQAPHDDGDTCTLFYTMHDTKHQSIFDELNITILDCSINKIQSKLKCIIRFFANDFDEDEYLNYIKPHMNSHLCRLFHTSDDLRNVSVIITDIVQKYKSEFKSVDVSDIAQHSDEVTNQITCIVFKNCMIAINYFAKLIMDKHQFIIESNAIPKSNIKKNPNKQNKLPSLYHILDARTIRKTYLPINNNLSVKGTKAGHERRRHIRTLKSDYFTNCKGETRIIEPVWVGPTDWKDDKRIYKIRLDL